MHLIHPAALLLLPLAALPLLRARRHQPRRRIPVGNLYLWRQVASPATTRVDRRLRPDLAAVLQAAVLLVLIAALARPVLSAHPSRAIVVFDVSASMGVRDGNSNRMDAARREASRVLGEIDGSARVRLLLAANEPRDEGEFGASDSSLRNRLAGLQPTAGRAALESTLDAARSASSSDCVIYVFSDQAAPRDADDARVRWMRVGTAADNLAVSRLAARRLPFNEQDGQVMAEVHNYGTAARDVTLDLSIGDSAHVSRAVHVEPRSSQVIVEPVRSIAGTVSARLVTDDALDVDNRRFAVVPGVRRARVSLAGSPGFFIEHALAANPNVVLLGTASSQSNDEPDVVACSNSGSIPDGRAGVLIIAPTQKVTPGVISQAGPRFPLTIVAPEHPVAFGLELNEIAAAAVPDGVRAGDTSVVVRAGDLPAVVAYEVQGRRVVEIRIDLPKSNLPLSPAFPILIANAVDWLAAHDENPREAVAGDVVQWRLGPATQASSVAILSPAGRSVPHRNAGPRTILAETDTPGIYRVTEAGYETSVAVNPATETESDLRAADSVRQLSAAAHVAPGGEGARETTGLLLLCALALLCAEWRVVCHRRTP